MAPTTPRLPHVSAKALAAAETGRWHLALSIPPQRPPPPLDLSIKGAARPPVSCLPALTSFPTPSPASAMPLLRPGPALVFPFPPCSSQTSLPPPEVATAPGQHARTVLHCHPPCVYRCLPCPAPEIFFTYECPTGPN